MKAVAWFVIDFEPGIGTVTSGIGPESGSIGSGSGNEARSFQSMPLT